MTVSELIKVLETFDKQTPVLIGARNAHTLNQPSVELYEDIRAVVIRATEKEYRSSRVVDHSQKARELSSDINKIIERGKA